METIDEVYGGSNKADIGTAALFNAGTSSNVTDAQKNFTTILQRQITAAADLLRAYAQYQYAIGYSHRP